MTNLYLPVCAFFISVLLVIIYYSKERVDTSVTRTFRVMLFSSFVDSIIMCIIVYLSVLGQNENIILVLCKLDSLCYLAWTWAIFLYIFHIRYNDNKIEDYYDLLTKITGIINFAIAIAITAAPLFHHNANDVIYSYGPSSTILYLACSFYLFIIIALVFTNLRKFNNKRYAPVYMLLLLIFLTFLLGKIYPNILCTSFIIAYIDLIMFFTMENPDIKTLRELTLARDSANKANKAKTEFLSSMSHEIRTPLNAIVGFSDFALKAKTLEEAKENTKDVVTASEMLLETVNGILDISKIEAGKIEIACSPYETKPLFEGIKKLAIARLGQKNLEFRSNIDTNMPAVLEGDSSNLEKVIVNLITNAIKYTDEGYFLFNVYTIVNNDNCHLIISVEDSGRGIKKENIDKLFTKFERLEENKNSAIEGTGLGLAITKQLIELMNGTIKVTSEYGKGSKFIVELDQKINTTYVPKKEEVATSFTYPNMKVALVDDNNLNLKIGEKILRTYELEVSTFTCGDDIINNIKNNGKFDLIFMDDMMPGKNGLDTLRELKKVPGFNTPIIASTANAISGMREKYMSDGFDEYLSKPIVHDDLKRILSKFFSIRKNRVLIVDDNKMNINIASRFLAKYNFDIETATSGDECINIIKNDMNFDIIFMDDMMPQMDGVEAFHNLEKIEGFNIPVVALTANAIEGSREHYLGEGMDEYLSKPINKDELDRIIKLLVKDVK